MLRIVVPGYRSEALLPKLLLSLRKHLKVPAELVVWDNDGATKVALSSWLEKNAAPCPVVFGGDGRNLGFGAAVNRALEMKTGREPSHALLMNADSELASDLDDKAWTRLVSLGGVVGLRLYDDAKKTRRQASARSFPGWKTAVSGREGWLTRLWPANPWSRRYLGGDLPADRESRVDWVSGCGLFCGLETWKKLGGFDERYFMYAEDVDLGRAARELGIPVHYSPAVDVVHAVRGSTGRRSLKADLYHHRSMWAYYWKWASPASRLLSPFIALGIFARLLIRRVL